MAFGKPKQPKEPKAPKKTEATDNSIKEQKLPKSNRKVKNPRKLAEKFEQELPEVARRLGIRVASPYGYYPEDVDRIILDLEESVNALEKENKQLKDDYQVARQNELDMQTEFNKLKMQMSLMEFPDASMEQATSIFDRAPTLGGNAPSGEVSTPAPATKKITTPLKLKVAGDNPQKDEPHTFNNLLKPRNKKQGE